MIDLDRARHALLERLAMELMGDETLFVLPMRLSAAGLGRAEIIDFFPITSFDFHERLTEEQQGILGDVTECLVGRQCQARQIIRLKGDPEDPLELAHAVHEQLRNWVPARGAYERRNRVRAGHGQHLEGRAKLGVVIAEHESSEPEKPCR